MGQVLGIVYRCIATDLIKKAGFSCKTAHTGAVTRIPRFGADVKVIHWQAGERGQYLDRLCAWRLTDDNGAFRFATEWRALRPRRIHFLIEVPRHPSVATQWIADDRVEEARCDIVLQPLAK